MNDATSISSSSSSSSSDSVVGLAAFSLVMDGAYHLTDSPSATGSDSGIDPHDHSVLHPAADQESSLETLHHMSEGLWDSVMDVYAASKIFCIYLVSYESLFAVLSSVGATSAYYFLGESTSDSRSFGANLSWIIVSFAVVSPMIMQIQQAFTRRETALALIAECKALFNSTLLANATLNWGDNGRQCLPADHSQKTKELLRSMLHELSSLLLLPQLARGRHRFTDRGRKIVARYVPSIDHMQLNVVRILKGLHQQVETMKALGLHPNEASRINQYHWMLQCRVERLQNIKFYRTPQATRSFTRLFILVLPLFYGPYYVSIARGTGSHSTNFGFCLALSVVTSLVTIGIFNVEKRMEDPFVGKGMDGVLVRQELHKMRQMLDECYTDRRTSSLHDEAARSKQ